MKGDTSFSSIVPPSRCWLRFEFPDSEDGTRHGDLDPFWPPATEGYDVGIASFSLWVSSSSHLVRLGCRRRHTRSVGSTRPEPDAHFVMSGRACRDRDAVDVDALRNVEPISQLQAPERCGGEEACGEKKHTVTAEQTGDGMLKVKTAACTGKETRSRGGIRLQGQRPFFGVTKAGTPPPPLSSGIHFQRPSGRHCVMSFPSLFSLFPFPFSQDRNK